MSRLKKSAAVAAVCATFVTGWEGVQTTAYQDVVGVWTVCAGETEGVKEGDSYSLAECKAMLVRRLEDYAEPIEKCLPGLPDQRFIAFTSLAYNIGAKRACSSTAANLVRAGKIREGCEAFMAWNKAGGIVFRGLTRRRAAERELCLKAV
ncbi:MAG: phage-related lysozyme protein [Xanthobacteraceae bacterium]|jgi:lysozyme|nr:phage-related lysozyme protein [Xanthobacteraceae bacterium]